MAEALADLRLEQRLARRRNNHKLPRREEKENKKEQKTKEDVILATGGQKIDRPASNTDDHLIMHAGQTEQRKKRRLNQSSPNSGHSGLADFSGGLYKSQESLGTRKSCMGISDSDIEQEFLEFFQKGPQTCCKAPEGGGAVPS